MPLATGRTRVFDRSNLAAYAGVAAAVTFIAAMTFGAIDSPRDHGQWMASMTPAQSMRLVSAEPVGDELRIR